MSSLSGLLGQEHWQCSRTLWQWLCTTLTRDRPFHNKTPIHFGWEAFDPKADLSGLTLETYQCSLGHDMETPGALVDAVPCVET